MSGANGLKNQLTNLLETVQIPRPLFSQNEPFRQTNLHVFCDASQDAYGASGYLRRGFEDNVVECRLVAEKGRVAPLEPVLGKKRYSSVAELRRVLAYVMRLGNNTRVKKELRQTRSLTATELRAAQSQLVKIAQVEAFGDEIRCLENGQEVHKWSRIKSLDSRMEGGFLVVSGGLQKAQALPYKARHPRKLTHIMSLRS